MTQAPGARLRLSTTTSDAAPSTFAVVGAGPDSVGLAEEARHWPTAYVHLPFCARVCPYCDFAVVPGGEAVMARYAKAVATEIGREKLWRPLASVYVGGGTPSRVPPALLGGLLAALSDRFGIEAGAEISLEANPEDWTASYSDQIAERGFERVSFGSQSFDPGVLSSLGRRHLPEQIGAAVAMARNSGFRSINLDLIFGTPDETAARWEATLDQAIALEPDHVSCYALTAEPGTELGRAVAAGAPAPDSDLQADFYEIACQRLREAGFVRYEVSNWARPGHAARYNMAVWGQAEYLAFGMGAHRFRDGLRSHNRRLLDGYLAAVEKGISPTAGREVVEGWAAEVERVFLGIRRVAGVVAGAAGTALLLSGEGQRLAAAGVIDLIEGRLTVPRPLLTDHVARALLALAPPEC